jgi:hypothetical protein
MIVARVLGWASFLAGLILLGRDLLGWLDTHRLEPLSFRRLWLDVDPGAFAAAQRHVPARLWEAAAAPALELWAWPALLILGLVLIVFCRPALETRRRPRRRPS